MLQSLRNKFGFTPHMIQYLKLNPLNKVLDQKDEMGAIYVGNIYAAYSLDILKQNDITCVLTVAAGTQLTYDSSITHMIINADDVEFFNLQRHFERMIDFIARNRNQGKNILVHCYAGISRSSTSVIAYMIKELGYTRLRALNQIRLRRPEIYPNPGFMRQLTQFENIQSQNNEQVPSSSNSKNTTQQHGKFRSQSSNKTSHKRQEQKNMTKEIPQIIMSGNKMNIYNSQQKQNNNPEEEKSNIFTVKNEQIINTPLKPFNKIKKDTTISGQIMEKAAQKPIQKVVNNILYTMSPDKVLYIKNTQFNKQQQQKIDTNAKQFQNKKF